MEQVRIYCIGGDGTEYYAAHSEKEMREWYTKLVGEKQAKDDFEEGFDEVSESEFDKEFDYRTEDGSVIKTTWRRLIASAKEIPTQLITGYN